MEALPKRKALRLREYDYSAGGLYFLTVCTHEKLCTLAEVRRGDPCGRPPLALTPLGAVTQEAIAQAAALYGIDVTAAVIMPNHIHLLVLLPGAEKRATARVAPTTGRFIGAIKSLAANEWRKRCETNKLRAGSLWQRGYYDHVVRDEDDYLRILTYMDENPIKWSEDCYYREKGVTAPCLLIPHL